MSSPDTAMARHPAVPPAPGPAGRVRLKAWLWSHAPLAVHAVVMGDRLPDISRRLQRAATTGVECLQPGALTPEQQQAAPWLISLRPESEFTDWLLFDAGAGGRDWGLLLRSAAPVRALRQHLRGLMSAGLPGGGVIALRWMDPPRLRALLPGFDRAGRAAFFGPVHSLLLPARADEPGWTEIFLQRGDLQQRQGTGEAAPAAAPGGRD